MRSTQLGIGSLDESINTILQMGRIPGTAIAVMADGELLPIHAYGCVNKDTREPLSPNTAYPIASGTKALTATLIGMLVDEGLLNWDVPVQQYLPGFRMQDRVAASEATLRDLIAMRTGLPRHDYG